LVRFLIKIVANAIARSIESGSRRGASIGCLIGLAIGLGAALLLLRSELLDTFRYAILIILPVPCGIIGALIGARLGPRSLQLTAKAGVRITRYNHAAGVLVIAMIFVAMTVLLLVVQDSPQVKDPLSPLQRYGFAAGTGALAIIGLFVAAKEVWSIDLGSQMSIRTVLGSRVYRRTELQLWGFEIDRDEVVQTPFKGTRNLYLQFNDGKIYRAQIDGAMSGAIIESLATKAAAASAVS
jgi:hypothetical protein